MRIGDNSSVPLRWIASLIVACFILASTAVAIGMWSTKLEARVSATEKDAVEAKMAAGKYFDVLQNIDSRLTRIEQKLEDR